MRPYIYLKFLIILTSNFTVKSQTCIISVLRSNANEIIVATDTRRTRFQPLKNSLGEQTDILSFDTICKVQNVGKVYFSNAGLDILNAYNTAIESTSKNNSLKKIVENFKEKRRIGLLNYLNFEKLSGTFDLRYENIRQYSTMFYMIENDTAKMALVRFKLESKVNEEINLVDSIGYFLPDSTGKSIVYLIGHHETADTAFVNAIKTMGMGNALVYAIEKQAESTPKSVGTPVELFAISSKGFYWILNPLNCKIE